MNNQRYRTWKEFDRKRWGYLNYGVRLFDKALKEQAKPYFGLTDLNDSVQISEEPIRNAFQQLYSRVARNFGNEQYERFKSNPNVTVTKQIDNWEQLISTWLEVNTSDLITNITQTTREGIERLLRRSLEEGLSVEDFAKALEDNYYLSRTRGRLIARTEIIRASNYGSLEGARQTGLPMQKQWLATQDNRTRIDHSFADGQTVPNLDAVFNVGGESMSYPGDPSASAGNTINCRCSIIYEPY